MYLVAILVYHRAIPALYKLTNSTTIDMLLYRARGVRVLSLCLLYDGGIY